MSKSTRHCEECGAPLFPGQIFCEQCGARVMDRSNDPEADAKGSKMRPAARRGKAGQDGLRWSGTVPAFSRLREGGPGKQGGRRDRGSGDANSEMAGHDGFLLG